MPLNKAKPSIITVGALGSAEELTLLSIPAKIQKTLVLTLMFSGTNISSPEKILNILMRTTEFVKIASLKSRLLPLKRLKTRISLGSF